MLTLGVISDTHVPDKAPQLNPRVFDIFREARVSAILHAGDISTGNVIAQLEAIAPVHAVKGNRDWAQLSRLPRTLTLDFDGVRIGLAHGHGGVWQYFVGKYYYVTEGYRLDRFKHPLLRIFSGVKSIVFGHTHRPLNQWEGDVLLFNPGSACCADEAKEYLPHVGLLTISAGTVKGELILLD